MNARMKRSRAVRLTLAASASTAAANAAAGCAGPAPAAEALRCVERGTNRVVADSLCDWSRVASGYGASGSFGATSGSSGDFGAMDPRASRDGNAYRGGHGGGAFIAPYVWYYGGRVASGYASAGGYAPLVGARYRSGAGFVATGASRPGFLARAFGRAGGASAAHTSGEAGHVGAVSRGGFGATAAAHGGAHGG